MVDVNEEATVMYYQQVMAVLRGLVALCHHG
jgi:hypothetical protein